MKTSTCILIALATLAPVGIAHASTDLIVNGSFEQSTLSGKPNFALAGVTDWSSSGFVTLDDPGTADNGSPISVYGPFPASSPDGGKFVEAEAGSTGAGSVSQNVTGLSIGQNYTLSFLQASGEQNVFYATAPTTEQWQVTLGNTTQNGALMSTPAEGLTGWTTQTLNFVANSTTALLTFAAMGAPGGSPPIAFLDGVHLTATPPSTVPPPVPVPEPASLALFGVGALGLFAALRRRRG